METQWSGHRELTDRLKADYEHRAQHLEAAHSDEPENAAELERLEHREIREAVVAAEREALLRLHERGAVSDAVLRRIERDLDLEALRMDV
jgi:CPA1 family monovalent cation:H+ antiporter